MKILAAIMDVVFVKPIRTVGFGSVVEQFKITKIKKFLVYDPNKMIIRNTDDEHAKQIR